MGVPALFRWLQTKYPKIIERVVDSRDGNEDLLAPNPNGIEFDNLYLDVNGIIHPCCHPEDRPPPKNEEEMLLAIYSYIDRIFSLIRPRKLLFLAADGVAPRAKMNQQRSRRFRAAKERELKKSTDGQEQMDKEEKMKGKEEGDGAPSASSFDSNCITPGTPFMDLIMKGLKYYISDRISKIPAWQNIKVVLSDSFVPGEGEHKIIDYIRRQRLDPQYNPNTHHVIYGLDADLIMLSLMTHEPHFKVLREDLFYEEKAKRKRGKREEEKIGGESDYEDSPSFATKPFIFLDILTLRDYLSSELKASDSDQVSYNLERLIDDWIFLCFFVGNDFLPHIPCLELREGAIDILIDIYKRNLDKLGGYICKDGKVNLERARIILEELGKVESIIFRKRREKEERFQRSHPSSGSSGTNKGTDTNTDTSTLSSETSSAAAAMLNAKVKKGSREEKESRENINDKDNVKLWEEGGKSRYYQFKLNISQDDKTAMTKVIKSYLEGVSWVMLYYFQGCPSWNWFYPYHYAPMASDFYLFFQSEDSEKQDDNNNNDNNKKNENNDNDNDSRRMDIGDENDRSITFEIGKPFSPFEQLMSVFPAASKNHIPSVFHHLMTESDSELLDYYPESFEVDLNGKWHAWQGIAILPFIDETRLLNAVRKVYPKLSKEEIRLNRFDNTLLYLHPSLIDPSWMKQLEENTIIPMGNLNGFTGAISLTKDRNEMKRKRKRPIKDSDSDSADSIAFPSIPFETWGRLSEDIDRTVCSFVYHMPFYERTGLKHTSNLLFGVKMPSSKLTDEDRFFVESGQASKSFHSRLDIYSSGGNAFRYRHHHQNQDYHQSQNGHQYQDRGYYHRQNYNYNYNYNYHDFNQDGNNYHGSSDVIDPASKYPPPVNVSNVNHFTTNSNVNSSHHSARNDRYHDQGSLDPLDHLEKRYKHPSFARRE